MLIRHILPINDVNEFNKMAYYFLYVYNFTYTIYEVSLSLLLLMLSLVSKLRVMQM